MPARHLSVGPLCHPWAYTLSTIRSEPSGSIAPNDAMNPFFHSRSQSESLPDILWSNHRLIDLGTESADQTPKCTKSDQNKHAWRVHS
jgi:hypothetical protein